MKIFDQSEAVNVFFETLPSAVSSLKSRLQKQYEQANPGLGDVIRLVIDDEEASARILSCLFPHLILPELVEIHVAQLGLQPLSHERDNGVTPRDLVAIQESPAQAVG
jgi:hypothetical protein